MPYSFCESVHATGVRWHIRKLTHVGKKLGGGIDTDSLCGHVRARVGGWDLRVELTLETLNRDHICPHCLEKLKGKTKEEMSNIELAYADILGFFER